MTEQASPVPDDDVDEHSYHPPAVPQVDGGVDDFDTWYTEAARPAYRFLWQGQQWELPNAYELDWRITDTIGKDELDVDDIKVALQAAFGEEQWARFASVKQPSTAMVRIFNRWLDHSGVDRGESSSSGGSSQSTAGRSKPTSTVTTASASRKRSTAGRKTGTRRGKS